MLNRRHLIHAAGGLALLPALPALSQGAPAALDTARVVVGFTPGGLTDILARRLVEKMRAGYAAALLVENKPGASGQIAVSYVKDATPDGSVMLLTHSSSLAMYPFTFKRLPYEPKKDLRPVSLVCHTNHALALGPAVPAEVRDLKAFLAWAKGHPERANYGAPGLGSMPHLIMTVVNKAAQADLRPITYKGTSAAITDLLGGQVSAASGPLGNFLPQVQAGKLRLIAQSGDARSGLAPDVPTYREQGIPMTAREWYAVYLPARATEAVQARASAAVRAAMSDPALLAALHQSGVDPASSTPAELRAMLDADTEEWMRLTREIGFTAES